MEGMTVQQQANTHPSLLVDRMDWHQKIEFVDAGNPVEDCSTMQLLH
jgi:hypothetical protein